MAMEDNMTGNAGWVWVFLIIAIMFGGNGFADDSVTHFTIHDELYAHQNKGWLKMYIPARSAVVLRKKDG